MKKLSIFLIVIGLLSACTKDFLETQPSTAISEGIVFQTVDGCQTALDGISRHFREFPGQPSGNLHDQYGVKAIDLTMDLMGEDMVMARHHWFGIDYQLDNGEQTYRRPLFIWTTFYRAINSLNNLLLFIDDATGANIAQKMNIKAQALALRAYCYHNLVEQYQFTYAKDASAPGVPLYVTPVTDGGPRASVGDVYQQIIDDLDDAIELMTNNPHPRRHISDVNLNVAHGLRARAALYMQDWAKARDHALAARQGVPLSSRAQFAAGFDNYATQSWLWGLEINDEQSTIYASLFSHLDMTIAGYGGLNLGPKLTSQALYNQMKDGDIRKDLIQTYLLPNGVTTYPFVNLKFNAAGGKEFAADYVMMRPEEMLLIEAEARYHLSDEPGARTLLQALHNARFVAADQVTAAGPALLAAVLLERRIELWGEGFRMRDIRRLQIPLDRTGSNHQAYAGNPLHLTAPANDRKFIYRLPVSEIDNNPNIGAEDQNP